MVGTFWALVPAIVAIALALITKEVYFSLLIGILAGAMFFVGGNPVKAVETTFGIMGEKIGGNANIIIFLVLLGILVALMSKSGASRAYGNWASRAIKSKRGALLATSGLGALIFVDDYFNCLTVGTVMSPVTDRHKISRAKLAYIIDSTAAPICIIAPISSWAAAVGSSLPEGSNIDGFDLFLRTIPFNLYALLTILMVIILIVFNFDFGPMKKYEVIHRESESTNENAARDAIAVTGKGKVIDLLIPIVSLIVFCIVAMLYTGGIFENHNIVEAFGNCDSSLSLVLGSFFALVVTFILYIPRKVITYKEFTDSVIEGFRAMVPAVAILALAWTLSGVCSADFLDAGGYVKGVVEAYSIPLNIMPAVFFLVALGLAFATGTSWGTFGILIPIAMSVFGGVDSRIMVMTIAAILAGAVCGDHVSPISDTTILSSTGANCNHIEHVSTQMPYALLVAGCCFVGYLVAGLTNEWLAIPISGALLIVALVIAKKKFSDESTVMKAKKK